MDGMTEGWEEEGFNQIRGKSGGHRDSILLNQEKEEKERKGNKH